MSRMLNPSPGEIADRQTILNLKIQHGGVQGGRSASIAESIVTAEPVIAVSGVHAKGTGTSQCQHFVDENERLQGYLEAHWFSKLPTALRAMYAKLLGQLATINEQLWAREDEARSLRSSPKNATVMRRAGELLFEITQLNDQRAELVQQINELFGVRVREKVYM